MTSRIGRASAIRSALSKIQKASNESDYLQANETDDDAKAIEIKLTEY